MLAGTTALVFDVRLPAGVSRFVTSQPGVRTVLADFSYVGAASLLAMVRSKVISLHRRATPGLPKSVADLRDGFDGRFVRG